MLVRREQVNNGTSPLLVTYLQFSPRFTGKVLLLFYGLALLWSNRAESFPIISQPGPILLRQRCSSLSSRPPPSPFSHGQGTAPLCHFSTILRHSYGDDVDQEGRLSLSEADSGDNLHLSKTITTTPSLSWLLRLEETSRRLEEQVQHMTQLVHTLQQTMIKSRSSSTNTQVESMGIISSQSNNERIQRKQNKMTKTARLFIDGTWFYYSLYEREGSLCPISRRLGRDWQAHFTIDWAKLFVLLQDHFTLVLKQDIQLVSSEVFTSYKADTSPTSFRYKMFESMRKAGYQVHMMETLGKTEKCVDIALAVELLTSDCDVALLLTGDKDFLPAMVRTRSQKELGLVSMKKSCNRALYETPHNGAVLDFNVIWLDDYVEQFVVRKNERDEDRVSLFTFIKVLNDFIEHSGVGRVSSRDVGRYLKSLRFDASSMSDELKRCHGNLRQLLRMLPDVYRTIDREDDEKDDPSDRSFWIELSHTASKRLQLEAQSTVFSAAEKQFFDRYSLKPLENKEKAYWYTSGLLFENSGPAMEDNSQRLPSALISTDYSKWTVAQLKDRCRERNLQVSGTKAVLVERVEADDKEQLQKLSPNGIDYDGRSGTKTWVPDFLPRQTAPYLEGLIVEYVKARGGKASSNDVGRYLSVNKSSKGDRQFSALQELKRYFGGVLQFVQWRSEIFKKEEVLGEDGKYACYISLLTGTDEARGGPF